MCNVEYNQPFRNNDSHETILGSKDKERTTGGQEKMDGKSADKKTSFTSRTRQETQGCGCVNCKLPTLWQVI